MSWLHPNAKWFRAQNETQVRITRITRHQTCLLIRLRVKRLHHVGCEQEQTSHSEHFTHTHTSARPEGQYSLAVGVVSWNQLSSRIKESLRTERARIAPERFVMVHGPYVKNDGCLREKIITTKSGLLQHLSSYNGCY